MMTYERRQYLARRLAYWQEFERQKRADTITVHVRQLVIGRSLLRGNPVIVRSNFGRRIVAGFQPLASDYVTCILLNGPRDQ